MSQRAPGKYLLDTQGGWDKTPCSTLFRNLSRGPPSIPSGVFTRGLGSSSTRTPRPCPFPWCLTSWHSGSLSLNPGPQLPRGAALGASHGCERRSAWHLPRRGTSTPSRSPSPNRSPSPPFPDWRSRAQTGRGLLRNAGGRTERELGTGAAFKPESETLQALRTRRRENVSRHPKRM